MEYNSSELNKQKSISTDGQEISDESKSDENLCPEKEVKNIQNESDNKVKETELLSKIIECVNFAADKHKNQRRKNKAQTPYINHPIGVANILIKEGSVYDPEVIYAAILHDTVEDTDTTFEEIEEKFGQKVRNIVEEVTDDKNLTRQERKRLQIVNAPNCSFNSKLVKLADKLYNLRDLEREMPVGWSQARVDEYFMWARSVIDGCRGVNYRLEEQLDIVFENHSKNKGKGSDEVLNFSSIAAADESDVNSDSLVII